MLKKCRKKRFEHGCFYYEHRGYYIREQERKILLLTALEGKRQKQISEELGINQSNVSRKLKAIRKELKSKLKDYL